MIKYNPLNKEIITQLTGICGADGVFYGDERKMLKFSKDQVAEKRYASMPEAVVFPETVKQVSDIMKLANEKIFAVTPRGAGSGLSGGAVPVHGGVVLSVERMNRIIEIDPENLMVVLEPGVVTTELDKALKPYGLFFAGYPMSEEFCFIGGNVAENAGGGRAVKYGVTGRYVHGLEVVMPTGEIAEFGGKRIKDVTGYDMVNLMTGSEGTLGIFTKIWIKLMPRPSVKIAVLALFDKPESAMRIVSKIMTTGKIIPTAIEFMDGLCFSEAGKSLKEEYEYEKTGAALLFEVDGNTMEEVRGNAETIRSICREGNVVSEYLAEKEEEINRLWNIRKRVPWVLKRHSPHQSLEDIVVPIANIPAILVKINEIGEKYDTQIPVFGHAGDGNLHATPVKNPEHSIEQWDELLPNLLQEMYHEAAILGGTISGEHGIGHKRKKYMSTVLSSVSLEVMKKIKKALDPNNILNPGKMF